MLAKYSIKAKLFVILSLLLLAITSTGLLALFQMRAMNRATQEVQTVWLPSIQLVGEMRTQAARYRAVLRDFLIFEDPKQIEANNGQEAARRKDYQKAWTAYQPLISTQAERDLVKTLTTTAATFFAGAEELQKRVNAGNLKGARETNASVVVPSGRDMDAILAKISKLNDAGAAADAKLTDDTYARSITLMVAMAGASFVLALAAGLFLVRDIAKGINSILTPMGQLTDGDLSAPIPQLNPATELGKIAGALQIFKNALIANRSANEDADVQTRQANARAKRIGEVTDRFKEMIGNLAGSLSNASTELASSANVMSRASELTINLSGSAASTSQSVSTNIQTVAAATEEITSSVNEIGRQVSESTRVAQVAVSQAEKTNQSVTRLADATVRIDHVVKLITEVAEQTNLLALNATIEAARAGDAGRGFAVVASEVKALSSQTAKATDEIRTQIADMQAASREAVETIKEIGATILTISEVSAAIAAAVEQQGAATQEIARNVQQSAHLSSQVANEVEQVSRSTSETGSASTQVLSAAQSLASESNRLKIEVNQFIETVQAA